jgi:hypothetical protein
MPDILLEGDHPRIISVKFDGIVIGWASSKIVSGSHTLPPRWPPQCSCVVIVSSFDPGERYKNQQSRQTGSRNLMGPKTLPTIWGTYMKLVPKYQISDINCC